MENKWETGRLSGRESRLWKRICAIPAEKRANLLLALVMTAALFVPVAVRFDFYYDLNDDVLIKDILSGVYSGSPDGHTMQLLYPLGFILSLLYRVLSIPVFGVFLVLCQYGSIYVIACRSMQQCRGWLMKVLVLAAEGTFWAAAFGMHLVFVQYTITAGMLAGAAIFWVLTAPGAEEEQIAAGAPGQATAGMPEQIAAGAPGRAAAGASEKSSSRTVCAFLRRNLPAFALYWLAFCLRSEMALLLLPLAGVAGLCKWGQERKIFTKENACKYLLTFGVLALGLIVCLGLDSLAYGKGGWPAFRQFFDERTELYDYQKDFIDNYEENAALYEAAGVKKQQHALLENYNFGVDDSIDEALLTKLREAAVRRPDAGGFFKKSVREGLWSLVLGHWTNRADFPYNGIVLLCGILALGLGLVKGHRHLLWQVPMCLATGAALWMFLLLRDRPVDRVFHPLYLGQAVIFAGLLFAEPRQGRVQRTAAVQAEKKRRLTCTRAGIAAAAAGVLTLCLCLPCVFETCSAVSEEYARREEVNRTNEAVMAYCSAHPGRLFLEDVYSTVYYSEKILVDRDKPFNYDLLGGWLVKSPLTQEKLGAFGYASMEEAVCAGENVSLLAEAENDMQWLEEYFSWRQIPVQVVKTGTVAKGVDVYQVLPKNTGESIE